MACSLPLRRPRMIWIDAAVSAKSQRVVIPGQFKLIQGLFVIGQRQLAASRAKVQFGILRINRRCLFIFFECTRNIARRFKIRALLVEEAVPFA